MELQVTLTANSAASAARGAKAAAFFSAANFEEALDGNKLLNKNITPKHLKRDAFIFNQLLIYI